MVAYDDDISPANRCSRIDPGERSPAGPLLQPATYVLTAAGLGGAPIGPMQTRVRLIAPGCTNGLVEMGEQCDDGNMTAGDGCSAKCRFDGAIVNEVEPNDATAQATSLGNVRTATITAAGAIGNMGADADLFAFEVTGTAAALTARVYGDPGDPESCNGDTILTLLDSTGAMLFENDDGLSGVCSEISEASTGMDAQMLAPGRYFLRVTEYDGDDEISGYLMDVRIR